MLLCCEGHFKILVLIGHQILHTEVLVFYTVNVRGHRADAIKIMSSQFELVHNRRFCDPNLVQIEYRADSAPSIGTVLVFYSVNFGVKS